MMKRLAGGQCHECGYDLRASSDLCPECGIKIIQAAPKQHGGVCWTRVAALVAPVGIAVALAVHQQVFEDAQDILVRNLKATGILAGSLVEAVDSGDIETARRLLGYGAEVNDASLENPVALNDLKMINFLLDRGLDVNAYYYPRVTALDISMVGARWEAGRLLLARGAEWRRSEVTEALIILLWHPEMQYGLQLRDANAKTDDGMALLLLASAWGDPKIVGDLLRRGADVQARDIDGMTALHHAIGSRASKECVKLLLDAGLDINATEHSGFTPLDYAWNDDTKRLLQQLGARSTLPERRYGDHFGARELREVWPDRLPELGRRLSIWVPVPSTAPTSTHSP